MIQNKKTQLLGTAAFVILASVLTMNPAQADEGKKDTSKDMSQITCADYLTMEPEEASVTLVWYDGWLSQEAGEPVYDYDTDTFETYQVSVVTACEDSQGDLLIDTVTSLNQ